MRYQYTGWDDPLVLLRQRQCVIVSQRGILSAEGISAAVAIVEVRYLRPDGTAAIGYVIEHSSGDDVGYDWVSGGPARSWIAKARLLLRTGIYKSVLRRLATNIVWEVPNAS